MGAFISIRKDKDARIPDERREEFVDGALKALREGGMFHVAPVVLDDRCVQTLAWPAVDGEGTCDVLYNWFEGSVWENAGVRNARPDATPSRRRLRFGLDEAIPFAPEIYSNKVGSSSFRDAIAAAYTLETLLLDGPSALFVDSEYPDTLEAYGEWIAWLLPEINTAFLPDLWRPFEALNDPGVKLQYRREVDWRDWCAAHMHDTPSCFISAGEILSVLDGSEAWLEVCAAAGTLTEQGEELAAETFRAAAENLASFRESSDLPAPEQMDAVVAAWERGLAEEGGARGEKDPYLRGLIRNLRALDAPAFGAKLLSETYDKPFWDVWGSLPESVRRRHSKAQATPVSTSRFFGLRDDDRIPWWTPESDIEWSREQEEWFGKLKKRFDKLAGHPPEDPFTVDAVLDLLEETYDRFRFVMCFQSFLNETLGNIEDPRIQACWRQFAEMANAPDPERAATKAFPYLFFAAWEQDFHPASAPATRFSRLFHSRFGGSRDIANVPLQRYLGLLGNRALRREVLGF